MQSYSAADGTYTLTVTFKIGTDLNFAQVLVQNRVSSALSSLPQSVQAQGVTVQKKSTVDPAVRDADLAGRDATTACISSNYATINLKDELVAPAGRRQRHRVRRRPVFDADLARSGQAAGARADAAGRDPGAPAAEPAGHGRPGRHAAGAAGPGVPVHAQRRRAGSTTPAQFDEHHRQDRQQRRRSRACATSAGSSSARRPTARSSRSTASPRPASAIFQSPGANALDVGQRGRGEDEGARARRFPQGSTYDVPFDTTMFVNASINEVYKTLIEAGVLVLIVILVFLQDWRAMLVPATTVPVTIIGAFAAMAALGFTVNLSTLFAHRAGDRHRGRRRDRRRRGRRAPHRAAA